MLIYYSSENKKLLTSLSMPIQQGIKANQYCQNYAKFTKDYQEYAIVGAIR